MAKEKYIEIKGARANNLKNIDIKIPQGKFVAITGVSGSGKSSLAFDTLYAEGQRRYVESLSSYARQFLGRMSKPECDFIKAIAASYCHRAESHLAQSALHSRNHYRDLRIPAPALCTHRKNFLTHQRRGGEATYH